MLAVLICHPGFSENFVSSCRWPYRQLGGHRRPACAAEIEAAQDDEARFRQAFARMDRDGNGLLDLEEFQTALSLIGGVFAPLSKQETQQLFYMADTNSDGHVDFRDFQAWSTATRQLVDFFRLADLDGDGSMQLTEWQAMMRRIRPDWSTKYTVDMFKEADANDDGGISFAEFVRTMRKTKTRAWFMTRARAAIDDLDFPAQCQQVFDSMDQDENGFLDEEEFVEALSMLGGVFSPLTHEERKQLFKLADTNDDGLMDVNEFKVWSTVTRQLVDFFRLADLDGDGRIDHSEWQKTMMKIRPGWSRQKEEQMFKDADVDGDGAISFTEFAHSMSKEALVGVDSDSVSFVELLEARKEPERKGLRAWLSRNVRAIVR